MNQQSSFSTPKAMAFTGGHENRIAGELWGSLGGQPVVLVHGGGQTRHSWRETAHRLAQAGFAAIAIDQRGHGDSAWIEDLDYSYSSFGADLRAVALDVARTFGRRPVLVGASLGGVAGLHALKQSSDDIFQALVLVDITPSPNPAGVRRILQFMGEHVEDGFASLEEAADAVAAYLPRRKRPRDLAGLEKNLRKSADGRYRWHWDPAFLRQRFFSGREEAELSAAARAVQVPVLLVRGGASDLVGAEEVRAFAALVPHARFVDVEQAGHMVAGDKNTVFANAVIDFITGLDWGA